MLFLSITQLSCKKSSNVDTTLPVSNPITKDTLSGFLRGHMLSNKTYYINGDIWVKNTDTLAFNQGSQLLFSEILMQLLLFLMQFIFPVLYYV